MSKKSKDPIGVDFEQTKWIPWRRVSYRYTSALSLGPNATNGPPKRLNISETRVGDILVCVGHAGPFSFLLERVTSGAFIHAAIVAENHEIFEAGVLKGVHKSSLSEFVKRFRYVVVLRSDLLKDPNRKNELLQFMHAFRARYSLVYALQAGIKGGSLARSKKGNLGMVVKTSACICSGLVRQALASCGVWEW